MKCWICGDDGTTGEHKTKASDLRALYSGVTQKSPLFLHTDHKINQKVGSIKSNSLKFSALICPQCNNSRTSTNDKAWENLSKHLREKSPPIKKGDNIRLHKVFPGAVSKSMMNVHLYFVKLFGCVIVEHKVPIDIEPFAEAILDQKAHPKVFLSFGSSSNMGTGFSNLETANIGGKCVYATWFYLIDTIAVNVIYAEPFEKRKGLINSWHPFTVSKIVKVAF